MKKIKRTKIIMVILILIFGILAGVVGYLSYSLYTLPTETEDIGEYEEFAYDFKVRSLLSESPVEIEASLNDDIEANLYILELDAYNDIQDDVSSSDDIPEDDYKKDSIYYRTRTSEIDYPQRMEEGDYVIVSVVKTEDLEDDLEISYDISVYPARDLTPLVIVIFIVPIVLCILKIYLLGLKKKRLEADEALGTHARSRPPVGIAAPGPSPLGPPPPQRAPPPPLPPPYEGMDDVFPPMGQEAPPEPAGTEVECYNCGGPIPVHTDERPITVVCPECGTEGELG